MSFKKSLGWKFRQFFKFLKPRYYDNYKNVLKLDLNKLSIFKKLKDEINSNSTNNKIIDFGCGLGYVTNYLGAIGIDINLEVLKLAKKNFPRTKFFRKTIKQLINERKKYSAIVCVNVIEHLEDEVREELFNAIPCLLDKKGKFYIVYDDMYHPLQLLSGLIHPGMLLTDPTHVYCWTQRQFRDILSEKFEIIKVIKGNILSLFLPFTNIFATARLYVLKPKENYRYIYR